MFISVPTKVTFIPMLSQMNLVQPSPTHSLNIHFNIIHSSTSVPSKLSRQSCYYINSHAVEVFRYSQYVFVLRGMYKNYKYCPGMFSFNSVCVCVCIGVCVRPKGQPLPVRVEDMNKILFVKLWFPQSYLEF